MSILYSFYENIYHVLGHVLLDLGKAYIATQVSNSLPTCVSVLDFNVLANNESTKVGEGFLEGVLNKERKYILVHLRDYILEKRYINGVVFWIKRKVPC
jgi:hypothetical protein